MRFLVWDFEIGRMTAKSLIGSGRRREAPAGLRLVRESGDGADGLRVGARGQTPAKLSLPPYGLQPTRRVQTGRPICPLKWLASDAGKMAA